MSLREIARFADVYEAELAGAFLASHGIDVTVTERFQTTVDPLMQRALGIRLMAPASTVEEARALLARVRAGEFATEDGDDLEEMDGGTRAAGTVMALAAFAAGGFWGNSLPRRFRPVAWQGMLLVFAALVAAMIAIVLAAELILNPP
ncbi:putative signal transducing protein [Brevundimonas sp. LjRoot202]|uniref:putative signal transducing protein n=1 Tax=Brevundimonas sp. LjRoot202 TaxID=3342281 RepID=UPI003ECCFEF3